MTEYFDNVKDSYDSHLGNKTSKLSADVLAIVSEARDYSKNSLGDRLAFLERMLKAKSFDGAMEAQAEYAKTCYEGFVAEATKMGELYSNLAKEAFNPSAMAPLTLFPVADSAASIAN
jgi:hypothetical protein